MFTKYSLRFWQVKAMLLKGNIANPICSFNPHTGYYYICFECYRENLIGSLEKYHAFLGNEWPLYGITNPKQFDSYYKAKAYVKKLGFRVELPLKKKNRGIILDYNTLDMHIDFVDFDVKEF